MMLPAELQNYNNFVNWCYCPRPGAKPAKRPLQSRNGLPASVVNPAHWAPADCALATATPDVGLGFVFSQSDPFAGIDLDQCRDAQTGQIESWAQNIIADVDSYCEISPSGTGVKLFVRGSVAGGGRRSGAVECYSHSRYFALTGQHVAGTPAGINPRQAQLEKLLRHMGSTHPTPVDTPQPAPEQLQDLGVPTGGVVAVAPHAVLAKAMSAVNGAKFRRLWSGDISGYGGDHSAADMALANMLAYWTDGDAALIDSLFRQSGLWRPKWDERRGAMTYGARTIRAAL